VNTINTEITWVIIIEVSSGHNVVSDDRSWIPGWSLDVLTDTHFHAPRACLGLGHASADAHDGPLANLCLLPTHGLRVLDGPDTLMKTT